MRRVSANLLVLSFSLLIALFFCEFSLRLADSRWERERRLYDKKPLDVAYQPLPNGLAALHPGRVATHYGACFKAFPISVNAQGFRGTRRLPDEGPIVLLGDSFAEALQVPDGLTLADRLEDILGRPVVNAGVSGYATTHARIAFNERLGISKPSLVILLFFLGNDVSGNSCALSHTEPPCGVIEAGEVRFRLPAIDQQGQEQAATPQAVVGTRLVFLPAARDFLRRNFALYALAHDGKTLAAGLISSLYNDVDPRWGLYASDPDKHWTDAWRITAANLEILAKDVRSRGAVFVLASVPEHLAILDDPGAAIRFGTGSAVPSDLDINSPSRRLSEVASKLNILFVDLLPTFRDYKSRHGLRSPYFSYSCDGHWNPLGHWLAAQAIADVVDKKVLLAASQDNLLQKALATPPDVILGKSAYRQIYEGGVYDPTAAGE